ncbi:MAG: arginine--tRNA ligase, partial [Nitrospinota bacterium]|nr:arginine--tRNA ligase [Nitrospinota bacterium]
MKKAIKEIIKSALEKAKGSGELELAKVPDVVIEIPKDEKMGDFATNVAMTLASSERKNPKVIAEIIRRHIDDGIGGLDSVETAGPGFLNIKMLPNFFLGRLIDVVQQRNDFGSSDVGQGTKILIEFVSANPTGPLHIGHGRGAAVGDALARILKKVGFDLSTEYYVNDMGNQMNVLGRSTWLRYLELLGKGEEFPENHYRGEYIKDIAQIAIDQHGNEFLDKSE